MLQLFNSLTRQKEKFVPLKDKRVGFYTCGPTVYDFAHIGNLRSYVFADLLRRTLKLNGFKVNWTMNITDVDDKTIQRSKEDTLQKDPKRALKNFTQKFEKLFWKDLKKLNIEKPDHRPSATGTIKEMQRLIGLIYKHDYAYINDGSVYFNVSKYAQEKSYGQLVKVDKNELKPGTRIDADEYEKENVQDFVLWKKTKKGEPTWILKLAGEKLPGRPGWHIECSAMSKKYLGVPFDIHTGGIDLKFPHHENEIAQSVTGYGVKKLANFFLHNDHVLVEGQKMAKRFQNFFTLQDLEKKNFSPLAYRYLILQNHYASPLNFTWESLKAAQRALENLYDFYRALKKARGKTHRETMAVYKQRLKEAINDDLDTPGALALVWEVVKTKALAPADKKAILLMFDEILGLGLKNVTEIKIPQEIIRLAQERQKARQENNWKEADRLRNQIEEAGFLIKDTEKGFELKKKHLD